LRWRQCVSRTVQNDESGPLTIAVRSKDARMLNQDSANPLILVVDDDAAARFMAREALEFVGFRVEEAENGLAALEAYDRLRPDIVLLDVMMPGLDGFQVCAEIRKKPSGYYLPIVMITGLDDLESITQAYQVEATDFITKPINYLLLRHRMRYIFRAKRTQDELVASEARLANAQRIARLGHWELQADAGTMHWSVELQRMLGFADGETTGTFECFLDCVHPEDRRRVERVLRRAATDCTPFSLEHRVLLPDGGIRTVYQEGEFDRNDFGAIAGVGTLQDITDRKNAEQQAHKLAYFDKVTGLPNRLMLKHHLEHMMRYAERQQKSIALVMVALDNFKRINDTLGYSVGDELLCEVARRLNDCLSNIGSEDLSLTRWQRPDIETANNMLAHLGGDEFMLMISDLHDVEDAALAAQEISRQIAAPVIVEGNEFGITASMGISIFPHDGSDPDVLLKQCGAAVNVAKSSGRNCYKFYTAAINQRAVLRLSIEADLRKSLEQNHFCLHYQPKVTARSGRVTGMEALVRWNHPELGVVAPAKFISIAEETGLIIPLGEWILREACRQVVEWRKRGMPLLRVSVNLSPVQFKDQNLLSNLTGILKDTGLPPELLELEITESLLMNDVEQTIILLDALKALGVQLSIDDFGIGYSSLSYLKRFPIGTLKVDQSFVRDVTHDQNDAAIVRAIIALAHSLKLKTVAEGVEGADQLRVLQELGCDEIQGYYYSRPLPAEAFAEWVTTHNREAIKKLAMV
jgi:PAS domain S-box-containing protein